MYHPIKVSDQIYYVGVNDRRTQLFENMWPLDRGVSYNSYLINDEKVTIIDTVDTTFLEKWLSKIRSVIKNKSVDYLVVNHMEPDHSGSVRILTELYPEMKIIGNKKTLPMLEGFFGINKNTIEISEGESFSLGTHTLSFHFVPMVHWPESMVAFETTTKTLFSSDAFGCFGALEGGIFDDEVDFEYYRNEMRRYYSNIVGKYGNPTQKALGKLSTLDIKTIAPSHGIIYRKHISCMLEQYDNWSRLQGEEGAVIAFASMYGNTEEMAEVIARSMAENGVKNIRVYDVSKTHPSYIIADIFRFKGLVLGSPTHSNELHPNMETLVNKLLHMGITNRSLGVFGSFSWAGAAVKKIKEAGEKLEMTLVDLPVEMKHALNEDKYAACVALGKQMAVSVTEKN